MRRLTTVVTTVVLGACGVAPSTTTMAPVPATVEELEVFCQVYESLAHRSRPEMMAALYEFAPSEIKGPIKRASEHGATFGDDSAIANFLQGCS